MSYKEEFQKLVEAQRLEDARVLLEENKAMAYEDSFYFANMGWVLNHIGRHQEAIPYLQKGIQFFPEDAWMYSQLAYAYNHSEQYQEALNYFLKGLEMGHDEPWIHGEIGWAYRQLKENEKAIEYFENALLDDPDNIWILAQAAFTYRDLGEKENAEEYLKKVYYLSPDDDSIFDLANFYKQESRFQEEVALLLKSTNEEYANWRDFELAYAYNRMDQPKEAIELLQACLARGRDDTGIREELADAYLAMQEREQAQEQYQIALSYYEKALERNTPDAYWILQDMVWIAHKQGDDIRKLQYLDRMNQIKPDEPWVTYHYAKAYANLGEYDKALTYCDLCVAKEGETMELLSLKAWILGKNQQFETALSYLERVRDLGRDDSWFYNELGWDHSELEHYEEAIRCYQYSLTLDDTNAWVYSQLGWNEATLEHYETALSYLNKAKELGREDGWLYANIGWVYQNLEQYEEAYHFYETARQIGYEETWFLTQFDTVKQKLKELVHEGEE